MLFRKNDVVRLSKETGISICIIHAIEGDRADAATMKEEMVFPHVQETGVPS